MEEPPATVSGLRNSDSVGLGRLCRLCGYVACPPHPIFWTLWSLSRDFLFLFFQSVQSKGETISVLDNEIEAKENYIPLPFPLLDTGCLLRAGSHLPFLSSLISSFLLLSASFPTMFLSLAYLTQGVNNFLLLLASGYFVILAAYP